MTKRALIALILTLILALAACGGDDGDDDAPPASPAPTTDPDATEEVDEGYEFVPLEPGLKLFSGLTMLNHMLGARDNTGYFYGEVRNDTGKMLRLVEGWIYTLDADGYELDAVRVETLLVDISPGTTFLIGTQFFVPEEYADAQVWVIYEEGDQQFEGYYDLPHTVTYHGPAEGVLYEARGTAENTSGVDLSFPVVDVALLGPDDTLVGLAHGVIATSAGNATWPAGETADWQAFFSFAAVDPDLITGVRVYISGYEPLR